MIRVVVLFLLLLLAVPVRAQVQRTDLIGTVNTQTGTSYTFTFSDRGKLVTFNNGSAVAVTLPQATSSGSFRSGWTAFTRNLGAGTVTITPTTSTINGNATLVLATGEGAIIFSNGTNYFAVNTLSSGGGGGSGVTTTGSPANGNLTKFSGSATITNGDLTGDVTTSGGMTTTLAATATTVESRLFCADAGANDTYACNLSPAIASYVTGTHYRFKANTANTGAATINFNSLGATTIKKAAGGVTTDLADNDIRAGQWVDLVYDGTNMQMQSTLGNSASGGSIAPLEIVDANTVRQINGANAQEFRVHTNATELFFIKTVSGEIEFGSTTTNLKLVVPGPLKYAMNGSEIYPVTGNPSLGRSTNRFGVIYANQFNTGNGGHIQFGTQNKIEDTQAGWVNFRADSSTSAVVKISFGDNNDNGPMFKRPASSSTLELKTAGDSNYTYLVQAGNEFTSAQFDKTNTTLADVTGLVSETLRAGKTYTFTATLFVDADVTGGSKYAIAGTATATAIKYHVSMVCDATNLFVITSRQTALAGSAGQAGCTAGTTTITGTITVNAAGTLAVQFAQNAANGTSSVLTMSSFEVRQLN